MPVALPSLFSLQVLFWGVREMKRINLTTVDRPQVDIDLAGHIIPSTVITNAKKNPNFQNPVSFFDLVRFTKAIIDAAKVVAAPVWYLISLALKWSRS